MDKKLDMSLTGVMDGCAWCEEHRDTWNDPEMITEGFPITRNLTRLQELWENLEKDSTGEVIRKPGDFHTRKGLCHKPVTKRDLWHFTICHKVRKLLLKWTDIFLSILVDSFP